MNRREENHYPDFPGGRTDELRWRPVAALAILLGLRMLGLFMVLPVLVLHVRAMPGATPLAVGLALGIYGLTQALLQLPFGRLSDRHGRKPVIVAGLLLFAAGSLLAALATTPFWLILGRALQGAGAISAAVMALVGDLTPEVHRTRAMALIGLVIGVAFVLAFVAGPVLAGWVGVAGLFWVSSGFALAGMLLLALVPAPPASPATNLLPLRAVLPLAAPQAAGIFALHAIMTATFLAVPVILVEVLDVPPARHGAVYLPVLLASLLLLVPLVLLQERRSPRLALLLAVLAVGLGQAGLLFADSDKGFYLALIAFFGGFNFIEAQFPATVSQTAGIHGRGAALGAYATAQFLGAFAGGVLGGLLTAAGGSMAVLAGNVAIAMLWLSALLVAGFLPGTGRKESLVE